MFLTELLHPITIKALLNIQWNTAKKIITCVNNNNKNLLELWLKHRCPFLLGPVDMEEVW